MQAYSDPKRKSDPHALPDVEVFYIRDAAERTSSNAAVYAWSDGWPDAAEDPIQLEPANPPGWYYWHCFPGCLPDSEPFGPFDSEVAALAAAQEGSD